MTNKTKKIIIISSLSLVGLLSLGVVCVGIVMDNSGVTYTLDSDINIKKIDTDIVKVKDSSYPGITLSHKDTSKTDFKVMAFTDSHLDHNKNTCSYTFSMIARNIMLEKPDLVVFCGDNITSSFNRKRTMQLGQLLEDLGVYWSLVLGNHEKNAGNPYCISRWRMLNIFSSYSHCLVDTSTKYTSDGASVWGVGNTVINLVSDYGVTQSLFFLESGTEMTLEDNNKYNKEIEWFKSNGKCSKDEVEFYDYIKDSQVKWYKETFSKISSLNKDKPHSSIFTHNPIKEQEEGYIARFQEATGVTQGVGDAKNIYPFTEFPQDKAKTVSELFNDKYGYVKGQNMRRREDMCYSPHDRAYLNSYTPIFDAMKSFGDNNAFFSGHDHQNNFVVKHDGVYLGYIEPAGYSTNNLYTKGMLGKDPYNDNEPYKYEGTLIQGYSLLTYKQNVNGFKNVLSDFVSKENHKNESFSKDLRKRAIDLIRSQRGEYKDKHESYPDFE